MQKTILIVEDLDSTRSVIKFTLEKAGYRVLDSPNGQDALKHLDGDPIDLVVTDFNMPLMDGVTLVREIRNREAYKFVPILLLTTESQISKKEEARAAGATGWIVKPFQTDKLLATIQKVLK